MPFILFFLAESYVFKSRIVLQSQNLCPTFPSSHLPIPSFYLISLPFPFPKFPPPRFSFSFLPVREHFMIFKRERGGCGRREECGKKEICGRRQRCGRREKCERGKRCGKGKACEKREGCRRGEGYEKRTEGNFFSFQGVE